MVLNEISADFAYPLEMPKTNFLSALLSELSCFPWGFSCLSHSTYVLSATTDGLFIFSVFQLFNGYQKSQQNLELRVLSYSAHLSRAVLTQEHLSACSTEILRDFSKQVVRGRTKCTFSEPKCEQSGMQRLLLNKAFTPKQIMKQNLTPESFLKR